MVIVAAVWSVAVGVAGIEIESGERDKMLIGCYLFTPRGTLLANSFLGVRLWLMQLQGHPYAPTLMDWVDILLVRIPLIYIVSGYAKWLAMRGDQSLLTDQEKYLETLKGFLEALEARDGCTPRIVGLWAAAFAMSRGSSEEQVQSLRHASEQQARLPSA